MGGAFSGFSSNADGLVTLGPRCGLDCERYQLPATTKIRAPIKKTTYFILLGGSGAVRSHGGLAGAFGRLAVAPENRTPPTGLLACGSALGESVILCGVAGGGG